MKRTFSILLLLAFILPLLIPGVGLAQGQDTCETATLHYTRRNADYDDWGLHIWGPTAVSGVEWTAPFQPTGEDDYGLIWEVPMAEGAAFLNYIVHRGDEKDPGPDQVMSFSAVGCRTKGRGAWAGMLKGADVALALCKPSLAVTRNTPSSLPARAATSIATVPLSLAAATGRHVMPPSAE